GGPRAKRGGRAAPATASTLPATAPLKRPEPRPTRKPAVSYPDQPVSTAGAARSVAAFMPGFLAWSVDRAPASAIHNAAAGFRAQARSRPPRATPIPWEVLVGIAANECNLGRSADPSCTLQPGATGPGVANAAGASGLMQIGIGGAAGDTYQRLQPYLPSPQLGPHDPTTAVQLAALTLLKLKAATKDAPIAAYAPYVTAYNGTGPAAVAYGQRVIADAQGYQDNGTTGLAGGCQTAAGNFANPLAGDTHVVAERIDMGVDYADPDLEPIDAIGAGTVTYAGPQGGGWQPNCINYTLDSPPTPTERYVYVCDHITPSVSTGQSIQPGQQIAKFIPDGGIETGWAAGPGTPVWTQAAALGQEAKAGDAGDNRTYCGQAMSSLVQQAGGPGGLAEGRPLVGTQC
ncbi:MAG: hypothetical protein WB761_14105, partial [Solirubrobacteraceae bacterium]